MFALAEAVTDPVPDTDYNPREEGSCPWKIHVRYVVNLPVASGVAIDEIALPIRDLTRSVRRQSHIKLTPEESSKAYVRLMEKAAETGR